MDYASLKASLSRTLGSHFLPVSPFKSDAHWGVLLVLLILLPFLGILILGLHSYSMMETVRTTERFEKATIEVQILQREIVDQLFLLEQLFQEKAQASQNENGFDGLRRLANNTPIISLVVPVDSDGAVQPDPEITLTYAEDAVLTDTVSDIRSAHQYMADNQMETLWSPVNSVIGDAYLYCWQKTVAQGFCILTPAVEVYSWLWQSTQLKQAKHYFSIRDSFNRPLGANASPTQTEPSIVINVGGLSLSVSVPPAVSSGETVSDLWLILAMTVPLLGLAGAIAWVIFLNHRRQMMNAEKLLHGTQEIAHELRTPLSNISLYVGLILRRQSSVEQVHYGDIVNNEMQRVTRIIDNATALMRGEPVSGYEHDKPSELLSELAKQYRLYLQEVGCTLLLDCSSTSGYAYPKRAVEHILLNLLSNAKKYAPGHQVVLGFECKKNVLSFWVEDQKIESVNASGTLPQPSQQPPGLGLGLLTCERLANDFEGKFERKITKNGRCYKAHFPLHQDDQACCNS